MFYEWWVGTATANTYSEKPLEYNSDYNPSDWDYILAYNQIAVPLQLECNSSKCKF